MNTKYLKTRENYIKEAVYVTEFEESAKKEDEKETKDKEEKEEKESKKKASEEEEVEIKIEVEKEDEEEEEGEDESTEKDGEDKDSLMGNMASNTGFNPSSFNSGSGHNHKQEWCIIKCMTNNGVKIGIDKHGETDCDILCGNLTYEEAINKVDGVAKQAGLSVFNDDADEYVGKVSKAYVKKPTVTKPETSYKPNNFGF